ncbi:MAG: CehA/McbA family metallohydrolase [Deltaproteobacteria bacterium]|nr:CehA/McbA family metallohydrolase [Deltaproteobacteria bacterium]
MTSRYSRWRVFGLLLFLGCSGGGSSEPTGEGLFLDGCPRAGRSLAKRISDPRQKMVGPEAVGGVGDYLLMNNKAGFVIQGVEKIKTYYYYGGMVVDAVAVDGCAQANQERFGEIGVMLGKLDTKDFNRSILRAFKSESIEVLNDGSNGKAAVVRVHGTDDYFWLVELELIREAFKSGKTKPLSKPLGVKLALDYILEPDANVLKMELQVTNQASEPQEMLAGGALFLSDSTPAKSFADGATSIGGFNLRVKVPWLMASAGEGSYAIAIESPNMATTNLSGVNALLDLDQALGAPLALAPAGQAGDKASMRFFVSVGGTDGNSAVRHLQPLNQRWRQYKLLPITGRILDKKSGGGLGGVEIDLQVKNKHAEWQVLDGFVSDEEGRFSGEIADFGDDTMEYRLVARSTGRPDPEPRIFTRAHRGDLEVGFDRGGTVMYSIKDTSDRPIPAKITFYKDSRSVRELHLQSGIGEAMLPPGDYEFSVTRGFEYSVVHGAVHVAADATAHLEARLEHLVDTTGFLSVDTHVHASPSADSEVPVADRIRTVAASGLEVVVSTDHETIVDWSPGVEETGLQDWVATVVGEEVTATIPEHTIMYPVTPGDKEDRGNYIRWYGMDIGQIFAAERQRGARVVTLNHPRSGCNYMCLIGYDRLAGAPILTDPTTLGLKADASLWSWDFNTIEYMNGPQDVFAAPGDPRTGLFDDWVSFLNHGRKVTAVGVTDEHGIDSMGSPRTYFASSTDKVTEFKEDDLVDAMVNGRVVVSTGAFARVSIGDKGLGDTAAATAGKVDLKVHIEAIPEIDVTHFKVFVNCDEAMDVPATNPSAVIKHDAVLPLEIARDSHVVVLGFGEKAQPRGLPQFNPRRVPRFTTNAIYVDAEGNGYSAPGGKSCSYRTED